MVCIGSNIDKVRTKSIIDQLVYRQHVHACWDSKSGAVEFTQDRSECLRSIGLEV
jgi:hypothetical protein